MIVVQGVVNGCVSFKSNCHRHKNGPRNGCLVCRIQKVREEINGIVGSQSREVFSTSFQNGSEEVPGIETSQCCKILSSNSA